MRIIITGGAGCLGSNLIEHLIPAGVEILSIDNYATGKKATLPDVPGLTIVDGSIVDHELVERCFLDFSPTHVIHSAAAYQDPRNWKSDAETNVLGTVNVADAAVRHGVDSLINFQTALVYGRPSEIPIPVTHPTNPHTSYGISKLCGENYLAMVSEELNVVSLRLANICAPRLAIGPIPTFYNRLKAGKACFCTETVRDFLDISDFLNLMDLLLNNQVESGVYNVSTGVGASIKNIFDIVSGYLDITLDEPVPVVPPGEDDIAEVVLDPSKTEEVLRWKSKVNLQQTIEKMLRWYDAYGVNDIYSHLKPRS